MLESDSKIQNVVSIITVVYNGEQTLRKTMESVCHQTVLPDEYLIINGNSTDGTAAIVKEYMAQYPFIKLCSGTDTGIYDAMNKGISLAKGQLIGLINSDDWYELNAIELVTKAYLTHGSGVYYGIQRMYKGELEYMLERAHHRFIGVKMIPHPATFTSADLYANIGVFDLNYHYSADLELVIRYIQAKVNFFPMDHIIANFRLGGASSTPKAALESLKVRRSYRLVGTRAYVYNLLKLRLKKLISSR